MLMQRRKNQRPNIFRIKKKYPIALVVPKTIQQNEATKTRIAGVWSDFCTHSSIHCISYFVDRKRHWIERVWWMCAFLLLMFLCISSIYSVYWRWCDNEVIISPSHKPMSIGEIPFPAVTICPETKTCTKKFNYTDVYRSMFKLDGEKSRNASDEELKLMKIINQICDESRQERVFHFFKDEFSDPDILATISRLAPDFEDTMVKCRLFDEWTSCDQFFHPTITEAGMCYTFNGLQLKEIATDDVAPDFLEITRNQTFSNWNEKFGNTTQPNVDRYPIHVYGTGKQSSFSVLLRVNNDDIDHICSGAIQGFKISFHPPQEGPQILKRFFHLSPGRTALITIRPSLIITTPEVLKYSPAVRQCFFNSERRLRFYKKYTQRNCEVECLSNFTLDICGCVEFSMPRTKNTKICGPSKIDCCQSADNNLFQTGAYGKCNCLADCESINYDADISQADYDLVSYYSSSSYQPNYSFHDSTFSRVVISFKEELFTPLKRLEFISLANFLANSGGIISLFMGASLLSFIELLYYFTLRVFFTRRKQNQIHDGNRKMSLSKQPNRKTEHLNKRFAISSYYHNASTT